MRLLADENFPRPTVEAIRSKGHDILWARIDFPGFRDRDLLECCETDRRLLLTLDKDFWQLALQRPGALKRSGIVLFQVHPATPRNLEPLVDSMLRAGHVWIGHIGIVRKDGIEMIPTG